VYSYRGSNLKKMPLSGKEQARCDSTSAGLAGLPKNPRGRKVAYHSRENCAPCQHWGNRVQPGKLIRVTVYGTCSILNERKHGSGAKKN